MYPPINLPSADLRLQNGNVWDILRKKFVLCTPEEWVRQHFIHFMINHLGFPLGRMVSEYKVVYNGMNKRCDIAVFDQYKSANCIVECKAPTIKISDDTFYQVAKYAHVLGAKYLILTNGISHYCARVNEKTGEIIYLETIPAYTEMV